MREKLKEINETRARFTGTFVRFGTKNGYKGPTPTVLLQSISDETGREVCGHLWFNLTKGFQKLDLKGGEIVSFNARVAPYVKGYLGRREDVYDAPIEEDYKLSYPTKARIVEEAAD